MTRRPFLPRIQIHSCVPLRHDEDNLYTYYANKYIDEISPTDEASSDLDDGLSALTEHVNLEQHKKLLQEYHLEALGTQRVLVVQPYYRSGELKVASTRREYMLQESINLVKTLGWTVVDKVTINVDPGMRRGSFFGSGQMENIKNMIEKLENPSGGDDNDVDNEWTPKAAPTASYVSAVFISSFRLTPSQLVTIEDAIGKPVLDRYNIVLQIFKHHATSAEAKLQLQLAEIPYLRMRLEADHELEQLHKHSPSLRKGEDFFIGRRQNLAKRDKKIRQEVANLVKHRQVIRKNRKKNEIPSVAVVGYTNCGKTSLIKVNFTILFQFMIFGL